MVIKDLATEECRSLLASKRLGRLACARDDQPYVIPFHFAYDGNDCLYAFSTFGQKIEWMRSNHFVCVEVDEIKHEHDWTTVIIFGTYEELTDTALFAGERSLAYDLLSRRPMWWQPAYVAGTHRAPSANADPIYFRIRISQMTGHRAVVTAAYGEEEQEGKIPRRRWWEIFGR